MLVKNWKRAVDINIQQFVSCDDEEITGMA